MAEEKEDGESGAQTTADQCGLVQAAIGMTLLSH
jgi:hypothetical protein